MIGQHNIARPRQEQQLLTVTLINIDALAHEISLYSTY